MNTGVEGCSLLVILRNVFNSGLECGVRPQVESEETGVGSGRNKVIDGLCGVYDMSVRVEL